MEHSFDVEIAKKLGIAEAILFKNISFWVDKNKANNKHFYDGKYWTYNSYKAFEELFPYLTKHKISSALKNLEDNGYIESGNYNSNGYDRTKWYSVIKTLHFRKSELECKEIGNRNIENQKPIPDSKQDSKPIIILEEKKETSIEHYKDDKAFIEDWNYARIKYLKVKASNIRTLTHYELINFRKANATYTIDEFRKGMEGLLMQKEIFDTMKLRPNHFLDEGNIDKYIDAFNNKKHLYKITSKDGRL